LPDRQPAKDNAWIGASRRRVEDDRLTTGRGCFTADLTPARCLHIAFLRSPHAAAKILSIDTDLVDDEGVVAIYTGADVADVNDLPVNPIIEGIRVPPCPLLAAVEVMAVGQAVAVAVATSREAAITAAENIFVDYEDFDPVADPEPVFARTWQDGDIDEAFSGAAVTVSVQTQHPRLNAMALEPRAVVAEFAGTELKVWLTTQTPHRARTDLAALLGLETEKVQVISQDVGGAFGARASLHPEEVLVAWAAKKLQQPVKWVADRSDEFLSQVHGRGTTSYGQAAFDAMGRLTGLKAEVQGLLGFWLPFSAAVPAWNAARILPGPYHVEALQIDMSAHATRTAPVNIYRGAGRPEAAYLMERLMDKAARQLSIDPAEIRQQNLISADQLPLKRPTGTELDSGDYAAALQKLLDVSDYHALRQKQEARRAAGELCGIGLALYIEPCGQGWESARVAINENGKIIAATGSSAQGQGRETAFQQIVADQLDVHPEDVQVLHGDTSLTPPGVGALASRSTAIGGSALLQAAREVRQLRLDTPGQATYEATVVYEAKGEAWSYGACLAELEIDPETGVPKIRKITWVDDAGIIVNPLLVKGQIVGGIAQGLGEVLMEKIIYDEDGQLLTGSLMDYAVPRADNIPEIEIHQITTPSPMNQLGAKGVGEAGTIGAPAAVMNALLDALAPLGIEDLEMPATSEVIWRALQAARGSGAK
jgi:aerobic carbon-monoxide dehydrogenase large subunit